MVDTEPADGIFVMPSLNAANSELRLVGVIGATNTHLKQPLNKD